MNCSMQCSMPDKAHTFENIQVQFHTVIEDWQARYDLIASRLSVTHELTWRTPFIWENWRRRR